MVSAPFVELLDRMAADLPDREPSYSGGAAPWRASRIAALYADRFGCCTRTAGRHLALVRHHRIPLWLADRLATLAGVPYASVIAGRS